MDSSDVATRSLGSREDDAELEDALLGRVLDGRYRILRRLGLGGMGAVYEAEHIKLESRVAIKVLQSSLSTNEKYRKRFLREARAASAIESNHIVRSSDFGATDDGLLYFAMELMEGQDLEQFLQGCSQLDWSQFEPVLFQITEALRAAHKRGVIHRDIKPSNCFLCATEVWPPLVKVLDFGIAKINANVEDGESPVATLETLTATNELFGTIAYMAPELIEGQPADARSDIYALGVLMFRALAGQLPFKAPNVYKLLQHHVSTPVPSLRALVPEIPAAVESVIFRALAKRPEHRYQSIGEIETALAAAHQGVIEPSAAALSGHTQAVSRGSAHPDPSPSGDAGLAITVPNAHAITHRVEDPGSLISARIRTPRFSPLAVFGLALAVSGGTAGVVFSLVDSPGLEPVTSSVTTQAPLVVSANPPAAKQAPAAKQSPTQLEDENIQSLPSPAPQTEAKAVELDPSSVPTKPDPPVPSKRRNDARKQTESAPRVSKAPATIDDLAGKRCPDAIGDRFTIEGVLGSDGKYISPTVSGSVKANRDCIESFIRTRSFGKGRNMEPQTVRLAPR